MKRRRRLAFHLIAIAIVLVSIEVLGFTAVRIGARQLRAILGNDANNDEARLRRYLSKREDTIGWTVTMVTSGANVDRTLARYSPAFPEPGGACLSLYGDSFAWGSDVSDEDSWANKLARGIGCRVSNYGVPGYGTDQALMRFEKNEADESKWVIVSIFPDNLLRNLTHHIGLVVTPFVGYEGLKPRYALRSDGGLEYRRMPFMTREELVAYAADPFRALEDDWFSPTGRRARNRRFSFPYTASLFAFLSGEHFAALVARARNGTPVVAEYLAPGHPSRALELEIAIVERFVDVARNRGKRVLVVMLPDADIVRHGRATGIWAHQPLIARLTTLAPVVDMGRAFAEALGSRGYEEIVAEHGRGHYTPEGNRMIAERVRIALTQQAPEFEATAQRVIQ